MLRRKLSGLFYGGCHGDDESQVFAELCEIVDDTIDLYKQEVGPCLLRLPARTTQIGC